MKRDNLISFLQFFCSIIFLFFVSTASASEPLLQFTSIPTVQSMGAGTTQTLTYTVRNNVPTAPIPIDFVALTPTSTIDEISSWTTTCNSMVPANGTCNISVTISATQAGNASQNLLIYYSDRNAVLSTPLTMEVASGLTFAIQAPSPATILVGQKTTLVYVLENQSTTSSISIGSIGLSPYSDIDLENIKNSCNGVIAPSGSCTVKAIVLGTSVGSATQALTIAYSIGTDFETTLTSNSVTIQVNANPESLSLIETPTTTNNLNTSTTQYLSYLIKNSSSSAVSISSSVTPSPLDTATVQDFCSSSVPANGTCELLVKLTAGGSTGSVAQTLQVSYGGSQVLSSSISYQITATPQSTISFVSAQPEPDDINNTTQGGGTTSQTLTFKVQNSSSTDVTVSGRSISPTTTLSSSSAVIDTAGTANIVPITGLACSSTCSNTNIPAQCACNVTAPFNAGPANGTANHTLSITTTNGSPLTITSENIIFAVTDQNVRNFTFVNRCNFKVWIGVSGGGQEACQGTSGTQANCPSTNETCFIPTGAATGTCYWNNPAPIDSGSYELAAAATAGDVGGVGTVSIPIPSVGDNSAGTKQNIIWSGAFTGRTGCGGGVGSLCLTADCSGNPHDGSGTVNPAGACTLSKAFSQPAVQSEFTLANGLTDVGGVNYDSYDMTMINGVNIPIDISPVNPGFSDTSGFQCGSPGSTKADPTAGIDGCSWNITPPSSNLLDYAMTPYDAAKTCTSQSDCSGSDTCGLAENPTGSVLTHVCGPIIGYWSADEVCSFNANSPTAPTAYACNQSLTSGQINEPWLSRYKTTDLYSCNPITQSAQQPSNLYIQSGYTANTQTNSVCGCVNWPTVGIHVGDTALQCVASTTAWTNLAQPQVQWLKSACPTAYVYPFDDATSGYICGTLQPGNTTPPTVNRENYKVTYCPGGATGGITS